LLVFSAQEIIVVAGWKTMLGRLRANMREKSGAPEGAPSKLFVGSKELLRGHDVRVGGI
jgi:hypothetical protein